MAKNQPKIRPAISGLKVGEEVSFHISKVKSVRTQASELGMIEEKRFQTETDREAHVIIVRRIE